MAEHDSYCPVNMATEVLGDRWTPLIVRELILGSTRFNDLVRALPGISRTLLSKRLRVRAAELSIVSGLSGRDKVVELRGLTAVEAASRMEG